MECVSVSSTSSFSEPGGSSWQALVIAIILACVASACVPRTAMRFDRYDGRSDAGAVAQFQQDDAICKGEAAKAQAMAAPIPMGRSLADAMEAGMLEGQRNQALRQIMVGCMAARGYSMTVVTVQP